MENKHNQNLDILRGIAALTVVCFHLVSCFPKIFDSTVTLSALIHYNFPGHMSVLIFFILSGYVININTPRLTNKQLIATYIRKRLIRIVPIYVLALLFTVATTFGRYDLQTILSNLFFVSVPCDNVIIEDGPLWSLNYELLYYFVFIFFSYYNISFTKTVKALVVIIAALFVFFHNVSIYPLIISYLIGFLFWATGAMIAERKPQAIWKISSSRVIAIFMLVFCIQPFNPYGPILKILKLPMADYSHLSWYQQSISYVDLDYYPLTILLILAFTHYYTKNYRYLIWFVYGTAIFRMFTIYKLYDWDFLVREHYIVPGIILFSSLLLWLSNFEINARFKQILKSASWLGGISYGVYMIHMPIFYLFARINVSSHWLFLLKVVAYFATVLFAAYLLEEKFQVFVKKILKKKNHDFQAKFK